MVIYMMIEIQSVADESSMIIKLKPFLLSSSTRGSEWGYLDNTEHIRGRRQHIDL